MCIYYASKCTLSFPKLLEYISNAYVNSTIYIIDFVFYSQEKNGVLDGLKAKAALVSGTFNAIEGVTCNPIQGAMYCFPRVHLPQKAVDHAKVCYHVMDLSHLVI